MKALRRAATGLLDRTLVLGLRGAAAILARLPITWVVALGRWAADATFFLGSRWRVVHANLDAVFGDELTPEEKRSIARDANRNAVLTALEMLRATHPRDQERMAGFTRFHPPELARSVDEDPRGVLLAIAHSGNFDGIGLAWAQRFSKPSTAVMKPLQMERVGRFLEEGRRRFGFGVIDARGISSMLRCVRLVNRGEIVCILPDQYARSHGAVIDFMGVVASTHRGAASVALQSRNARILVAVDTRIDNGPHHVCHLVEIDDFERSDDFEKDVVRLTQRFADEMGEIIRRHPESYLWHHRRWGHPGSDVRRLGKGGVVRS